MNGSAQHRTGRAQTHPALNSRPPRPAQSPGSTLSNKSWASLVRTMESWSGHLATYGRWRLFFPLVKEGSQDLHIVKP